MKLASIVLLSLAALAVEATGNELDDAFGRTTLVISSSRDACYVFDTWLALTDQQRQRGLMHVREMDDFAGMLFVYRRAGLLSMWMKNTFIPLDMLFVRAAGSIASIAKQTEPHSLESIRATEPVNYVLELNGGVTDRLGIDTDSTILLPLEPRNGS